MVKCNISFPIPLPDDPHKWNGWSKYKSPNYYERLCLDHRANPTNDLIEEHCRELMRWWQKKLPLKNQPSNPLAQLLRSGLEESSRYLTQARVELLDPGRRQRIDQELAAQEREEAVAEFHKYLAFALVDGVLTPDEEANLLSFGRQHSLTDEAMQGYIETELRDCGARRKAVVTTTEAPPEPAVVPPPARRSRERGLDKVKDFMRMLRLSGLDTDSMTDDQRDAFINMAENLGIEPDEAEDLVDEFLEEADKMGEEEIPTRPFALDPASASKGAAADQSAASVVSPIAANPEEERAHFNNFQNSIGCQMVFVPSGEFLMGSEAFDAPPNEKPLTKVMQGRFYMSRHPITNAQYEQFEPGHARKRAPGAADDHPVLYVSSLEAIKFCHWLTTRERKKYRLPTEAEWEYAARGTDGRKYPWGNLERRGDLANFADKNTVFAWSDREVNDGFAETSPVGAYPHGASPFGLLDMAGNVWEWCVDYYEPYKGIPRINPRGAPSGSKRIYRGGSWKSRFNSLRATTRGSNVPGYSCNDLGFRVVCDCE